MSILKTKRRGFSLIEVLIAILVLSTGMLALAALQSSITRNSVSSKARSQAVAAANDVLDMVREGATRNRDGFESLASTSLSTWTPPTVGTNPTNSQTYQRRVTVSRLTPRNSAADCGGDVAPCLRPVAVGAPSRPGNAEVKRVDVQVSWTDDAGITQSVQVSDLIPYAPRTAQDGLMQPLQNANLAGPGHAVYQIAVPSEAGIIPIAVGDNQDTAATNPKPILNRSGAALATSFEVLTYQTNGSLAEVQRKVDTLIVQCRCEYRAPPNTVNEVFKLKMRPTYWTGKRYADPESVADAGMTTPTTWSADLPRTAPEQSKYCDDCCRDHHDPIGTTSAKFDPFRTGGHDHFNTTSATSSVLSNTPATSGQYVDACRLIRVDGYYRVANDIRLMHMNLLETANVARSFAPSETGIENYQNFVLEVMRSKVGSLGTFNATGTSYATQDAANNLGIPLNLNLTLASTEKRFLHDRGLYIDYLEPEAIETMQTQLQDCTTSDCLLPFVPFTSINTTEVAKWSQVGYVSGGPQLVNVTGGTGTLAAAGAEPNRGKVTKGSATVDGTRTSVRAVLPFSNSGLTSGFGVDADDNQFMTDTQAISFGTSVDSDGDGVSDATDNCPAIANPPPQADLDLDGVGDVCDPDVDGDRVLNAVDNCPVIRNPGQEDLDGDGRGDACEDDTDGDGHPDTTDNCPFAANPDQGNQDGDVQGDACDTNDDNDAFDDSADNCPLVSNNDQINTDGDTEGNACDLDDDNDTINDDRPDNCPLVPNLDQADADGDGVGDACEDSDRDGISDVLDNCPVDPNPDQLDTDGDREGDVCDMDIDGDGRPNPADNCPTVANPDQADSNGNGIGDVCEGDADGDGVRDDRDNCPNFPNPDQADSNGNGVGDVCDSSQDTDGDGIPDAADNCPLVANTDQADSDRDGIGDACDALTDSDGDGIKDAEDNCPFVQNPNQLDTDGDGIGDVCDSLTDSDRDGIADNVDNCPTVVNPAQTDTDGDGLGDACDPAGTINIAVRVTAPFAMNGGSPPTFGWVLPVGSGACQEDTINNDPDPQPYGCAPRPTYGKDVKLTMGKYNRQTGTTNETHSTWCTGGNTQTTPRAVCTNYRVSQVTINGSPILATNIGLPVNSGLLAETTTVTIPSLFSNLPNTANFMLVVETTTGAPFLSCTNGKKPVFGPCP